MTATAARPEQIAAPPTQSAGTDGTAAAARTGDTWHEFNQRYLMGIVGLLRRALERYAAHRHGEARGAEPPGPEPLVPEAARAMPAQLAPPAIEVLRGAFGLSPFERDLLLLCAATELDAAIGPLCAAAQGEPSRPYPTFGLALTVLGAAHWSALSPSGPLRHWRLIEVEPGGALTTSAVRIDERVLHYLAGVPHLDQALAGSVQPVNAGGSLPQSHAGLAARIAGTWREPPGAGAWPVIQLCGDERSAKRDIAAAACAAAGLALHALPAELIPATPAESESLRRLWEREAVLAGSALLLDCDALDPADHARWGALTRFLEVLSGVALVATREPLRMLERPALRYDVMRPSSPEQLDLWRASLAAHDLPLFAGDEEAALATLAAQFSLSPRGIRAAVAQATSGPALADGMGIAGQSDQAPPWERLWDTCRAQARARLDDLAQRIEPAASWDDLVLPEAQRQTLREITLHVRQRARVYDAWGFAAKSTRGLGISALFAGASGTGKTMAAEVLAGELRLDLYRIDLSSVVSKYIGETEKNLRRVFDAAEAGGAILLFDEADALFGKRSEVKDSHDRYANIEISYLLQRMEAYRGLAILTTNLKSALDPAFLRRIRFIVQFPFPDAAQRAEIWRRIFPPETPVAGLDVSRLARLNVAGGNIRNIAVNAAFLAADVDEPVGMAHLARAARAEFAKLDKALTEADIGGWT